MNGAQACPQSRNGAAGTGQRALAVIRWIARHVMLLLAAATAVRWMPSPWNGVAGVAALFILGATRSYQRRLARRVQAVPPVRAAVAWLVVPPPEKD